MAVTLQEIAKEAAVSHMTVSRVLNGKVGSVSTATRERVMRIATKAGYRPNINARAFARQKSLLIGVLFNEVNYIHATQVLSGIQKSLVGHDYAPIFLTHGSVAQEEGNLELCLHRGVDALIVNPWGEEGGFGMVPRYAELHKSGMPMVEISNRQVQGICSICHDSVTEGRLATRYLLDRGHRRIVLFTHSRYRATETEPGRCFDSAEQWQGYCKEMHDAGLEPVVVTHPIQSVPLINDDPLDYYRIALQGVAGVLDHPSQPTGVVCGSRYQSLAVLTTAKERGLEIPRQLSVVAAGYDGPDWPGELQVTSFSQRPTEMGLLAGNAVLECLRGKSPKSMVVEPLLHEAHTVEEIHVRS